MKWAMRVGFLGVVFLTMIVGMIAVTWRPGSQTGTTVDAALVAAAREGATARTASLLGDGVDPDSTDADGYSALWWAVRRGHAENVVTLVEAGADPDVRAPDGDSPRTLAQDLAVSEPSPARARIAAFLEG
ncbi:MAG: ankyrin repeat domain-containing protein [Acidimicrobiia bacterium]|nr:ankyrin repeat domain-containing protein [Acidimicrobiia bacterium]